MIPVRSTMKYFYIATLFTLASCKPPNDKAKTSNLTSTDSASIAHEPSKSFPLINKSVRFLWRVDRYDEELKDSFNSITIDEQLCKTLSDPERAALGFVATFIGSECNWDGEANDDFSNLKCKTLDALNLGYQCSTKHLGFLRTWFRNDSLSLKKLENCPTIPYTASSQTTFDHINLKVQGVDISVEFGANGVNIRMGQSWSWTETDHFRVDNNTIKLIKKIETKLAREHFDPGK